MYQFFVEPSQIQGNRIVITGSDVNHIKNVLRMKPGEKIRVCTRNGQNYFCSISDITESFVRADILEKEAESTELPCRIYLFQGLPKNDKMEWIIQKTVELGVYEVIPVAMKNCVVKLDDKNKGDALAGDRRECSKTVKEKSDPGSEDADVVQRSCGICQGTGCETGSL